MKIVFTVASYYPSNDGVQYVTQYHAEGLVRLGHEVIVITSKKNDDKSIIIHNGVKVIYVNAYNFHFCHIGNKKEFLEVLKEEVKDADIMTNVCLQSYSADWVLSILPKIKAKKVLYMHGMHSFKWEKKDFQSLKAFCIKLMRNIRWRTFYLKNWNRIAKYDAVIHLHEMDYAYEYFKNHGYTYTHVLYNAVDNSFFEKSKKRDIIINVGSFNERKNQEKAIRLFYESNTGNYSLVIIGTPENAYYQKLLEIKKEFDSEYGTKDVRVLCNIPREETIGYIKSARIYLMTSTWEAFPISLVEAMAARMGFISSNVGVISTLPGGIICKSDSEFINAIESLTEDYSDTLEILSSQAYTFAKENLSQDIQIRKLEGILNDLLVERGV